MTTTPALPEKGVRQGLLDPYETCRLCFQAPGTMDVFKEPKYLTAIKNLYNIDIKPTDKYTKSVCDKCIGSIQELWFHQEMVELGQRIFSKRIEMIEQMSHMKVEPGTSDRATLPGDSTSQPLASVDKQEDSDEDMDDVVTQAPTSPQNLSPLDDPNVDEDQQMETATAPVDTPAHKNGVGNKRIQSLKTTIRRSTETASYCIVANDNETRSIQTRPKTPMKLISTDEPLPAPNDRSSKAKRPYARELRELLHGNNSIQPGRVSQRRSTMNQCFDLNALKKSGRKRRMSCSSKNTDNDTVTTPKRICVELDPVSKSVANNHQKAHDTPKKSNVNKSTPTQVNSNGSGSLRSNFVAAADVDTTVSAVVSLSTPRTKKSQIANRRDKSKMNNTPRITQFFTSAVSSTPTLDLAPVGTTATATAQASSPIKCDTCSIILGSHNELNFHIKSHEMKCCVKCKAAIDNENPISNHMISCFLLNSKLSNDKLTRFLKVKVDLDRLTPVKIQQIQKDLLVAPQNLNSNQNGTANGAAVVFSQRGNTKKGCGNAKSGRESLKESSENADRPVNEKSRRESMSSTENVQTSIIDKTINGKNDQDRNSLKKSKNKKTTNKSSTPKNLHNNDLNDEFKITENSVAALNWVDEANKDKIFSLRNFECDANIYINIKEVVNTGTNAPQQKISDFVKRINLMKQRDRLAALQQAKPVIHVIQKPSVPADPVAAATPSPLVKNVVNAGVVANATVQVSRNSIGNGFPPTYAQSIQMQAMQNTMTQQTVPHTVTAPIVSVPFVSIPRQTITPLAPHTPSMQPTAYAPNTPNASNTPNVPQLLGLPALRKNRAYSVHFAPNEHSANRLKARRQSIGESLMVPFRPSTDPSTHPTAAAAAVVVATAVGNQSVEQASDHTYTVRNTMSNLPNYFLQTGRQPPAQAPPPPPYITTVHAPEIAKSGSSQPTTLKVLTPDDLNSRAANAAQPIQSMVNNRTDSPNSTENNTNLNNNNNQPPVGKRVRTKTTPLRSAGGIQISDDANITISVSLSKLGADQAELTLTTEQYGKISYDGLTEKRKQEVQSSLLKDDVWQKMLFHLRTNRPTNETVKLFKQILPPPQNTVFMTELRKVYGNRI